MCHREGWAPKKVDTRRYAIKDTRFQKKVDLGGPEVPRRFEKGTSASENFEKGTSANEYARLRRE